MILTDKAKDDFENWVEKETGHFLDEVKNGFSLHVNALIIEWFDSVGYFIEITKDRYITEQWVNNVERFPLYKTRQEATKQAIISANEIYNNKGA